MYVVPAERFPRVAVLPPLGRGVLLEQLKAVSGPEPDHGAA